MKTGDQDGWAVYGYVKRYGRTTEVEVGIYESFRDADQAADEFFATTRAADRCTIEKHYVEEEETDGQ
jgi:hypothetical protein